MDTIKRDMWYSQVNPFIGSNDKHMEKRQVFLHWLELRFQHVEDLFGEERGQISLSAVLSVRILDEDSNVLAIQSTDRKTRFFKGETNTDVEEWVSAIRSAGQATKKPHRRQSKNMNLQTLYLDDAEAEKALEVTIPIITVKSTSKEVEYVAARSPSWDRVITINDFRKGKMICTVSQPVLHSVSCRR